MKVEPSSLSFGCFRVGPGRPPRSFDRVAPAGSQGFFDRDTRLTCRAPVERTKSRGMPHAQRSIMRHDRRRE
jgi:hypothetical protein